MLIACVSRNSGVDRVPKKIKLNISCSQWTDGTLAGNTTTSHFNDVIMGRIASQITSLAIVYSTVYSDADQRKHQSSASLAFVREIDRGPMNSPHKWPVTRKMFPFDDVIMNSNQVDCAAPPKRTHDVITSQPLGNHCVITCYREHIRPLRSYTILYLRHNTVIISRNGKTLT